MNLEEHLKRQIAFSRATFGPGPRTVGVIDHISKELVEVATATSREERVKEWVDVVILALDGLTRELMMPYTTEWSGREIRPTADFAAEEACDAIVEKQAKNELRDWPDWRKSDPNKAIEHVRG